MNELNELARSLLRDDTLTECQECGRGTDAQRLAQAWLDAQVRLERLTETLRRYADRSAWFEATEEDGYVYDDRVVTQMPWVMAEQALLSLQQQPVGHA